MLTISAVLLSLIASSFAAPQGYSGSATTHTVVVGGPNGELTFTPEAIFANVGDMVIFEFHQKNHSAVQSSFANPCGKVDGGFNSGYMPVDASVTSGFPTANITVQDTKPIWIYCSQGAGAHCHAGMVFAVNCGADGAPNSFTNFKNSAIAQGASASGSATSATATTPAPDAALPDTTTYPGITIPPAPAEATVTSTIVVGTSTWTTTYASYPNSPDPTPNSLEGSVILVKVGADGLTYTPSRVSAKPRDTIVFEFHAKNHTATQSSFADPCRKLEFTSPTPGVDSGFMGVAADATVFPTYNVTVNGTAPMWFYCRQTGHCGQGMVFAVNSDESSSRSFDAFKQLAIAINGTSNLATNGTTPTGVAPGNGAGKFGASLTLGALSVVLGAMLL